MALVGSAILCIKNKNNNISNSVMEISYTTAEKECNRCNNRSQKNHTRPTTKMKNNYFY